MNCISSRHACFYGALVDTYQILSIQNLVYSDKCQSIEGDKCLKWRVEGLFSLVHTCKVKQKQNGVILSIKERVP